MIQTLLHQAVADNATYFGEASQPMPAERAGQGIPTLAANVYRTLAPMLQMRFEQFGGWRQATHGNWLSLQEMETLWGNPPDDKIAGIKRMLLGHAENWANDAIGLFKPERISIFAGDDEGNERIYLLWFDWVAEPELWVYDTNGEARYKNLELYLKAYLNDDLGAYDRQWILEYPTNVKP